MGLFKKDWEKWEKLSRKWEEVYNEFMRGADEKSLRKVAFFIKKIDKLTRKTRKKMHPDYYAQVTWLIQEIKRLAEYQLKHGFIPDYMWNLNSHLASMFTLIANITHWMHYGTVAPNAMTHYSHRARATYPSAAPYYANPYTSSSFYIMPFSPMFYTSRYYGRYRSGRLYGLTGLLALFALQRMLTSAAMSGGKIDTTAFHNAVAHLKSTFEANKSQLASKVGHAELRNIENQINALYNSARNALRTGRIPPSEIGNLNQLTSNLSTRLQPALREAIPLVMASMKSLSGAINGVLNQISRKGFVSQTDYYQLKSLYGQLMSYLNTLPPEMQRLVDPKVFKNLRNISANYGNVLNTLQNYVGKPINPNVLRSLQGVTNDISRNVGIFMKQLNPQTRNIIEQASRVSSQIGQQVNPFSAGIQQTISSVSKGMGISGVTQSMFRQQRIMSQMVQRTAAQATRAFTSATRGINPSIMGGLASLSRESQRFGKVLGDIVSGLLKGKK